MLRPILATSDPYAAAQSFCRAGWQIDFTEPEGSDPLCGVSLFGSRFLLGTMEETYVPAAARGFVGAGVVFYIGVAPEAFNALYESHRPFSATEPVLRPWGDTTFSAVIEGYRFMIAARCV